MLQYTRPILARVCVCFLRKHTGFTPLCQSQPIRHTINLLISTNLSQFAKQLLPSGLHAQWQWMPNSPHWHLRLLHTAHAACTNPKWGPLLCDRSTAQLLLPAMLQLIRSAAPRADDDRHAAAVGGVLCAVLPAMRVDQVHNQAGLASVCMAIMGVCCV